MSLTSIPHSRPSLNDADHQAVARTLASGMIAEGALTRTFEQAVGDRLGVPPGVATGSGTEALVAALFAVGVAHGDEVIMPTYVCDAVWVAIRGVGATPVLCDVGEDRCVSAATIGARVTSRTAAVVAVHSLGAVADIPAIKAAAGVPVIEDCCQAFGALLNGKPAGTIGDACVLSFHATKLLTTGEGGMALSANVNIQGKLAEMRRQASRLQYQVSPLADIQSALGLSQLARYDSFLARRRQLADYYSSALATTAIALPQDVRQRSVYYRFPVRAARNFDDVQRSFAAAGVHVRRGVDTLIHARRGVPGQFPIAERLFEETVSLPIYPSLTDADAAHVAHTAQQVFGPSA